MKYVGERLIKIVEEVVPMMNVKTLFMLWQQ